MSEVLQAYTKLEELVVIDLVEDFAHKFYSITCSPVHCLLVLRLTNVCTITNIIFFCIQFVHSFTVYVGLIQLHQSVNHYLCQ